MRTTACRLGSAACLLAVFAACGGSATDDDALAESSAIAAKPDAITKELNFLFVPGVANSDESRASSDRAFVDLEAYLLAELPARAKQYEAAHPNEHLVFKTRRANLYTDANGKVLEPSIDAPADGTGVPAATRWREQLAHKLELAFPNGERNIVLVGHSTGAKVAMEVAADVGGAAGPGSHRWGVSDRIAGVVTVHGILDALQDPTYNVVGPLDYVRGCKFAQEDGWCDYSGRISAFPAADWVATNKRALMLTSWGDCSVSGWAGQNDKSIPFRVQGSPNAFGMTMTPDLDGSYVPAHGLLYGHFCHSDLVSRGSERHAAANAAAGGRILEWVFDSAPRVVNAGEAHERVDSPALASGAWSERFAWSEPCPAGEIAFGAPDVKGNCSHPGFFDGSDHAFDDSNPLEIARGPACGGSFRWSHQHDDEHHAARAWFKSYSVPAGGGLLSTLP